MILASLEFEAGNWNRAQELAREAYDVAVQTGRRAAEPKGLYTLALIEAARGNANTARALAEQSLVLTDGRGWSSGGPRGALGFLELSLENYEAAYNAVMPAIERYRTLGAPVIGQTFDAAEALAGMGRLDEGRALLDRCDDAPGLMRLSWAIAAAARARGLLDASDGDLVAAEVALEQAVDAGAAVRQSARARPEPAGARQRPAAGAKEARGSPTLRSGARALRAARSIAVGGAQPP